MKRIDIAESRLEKLPYEPAVLETVMLPVGDVITTSPIPEDTDENQGSWDAQML